MKLTFLGTGTSCGVPLPTCPCAVCNSSDPRDNRLRCSAMIETDDKRQILVDCGPDFRIQAIRSNIRHIDALLLTHNHFDHCFGIDDLRAYCFEKPLPTYADAFLTQKLKERHDYIFVHRYPGTPQMNLVTINPGETFLVGQTPVTAIRVFHGKAPILAFRIGNLAYITDCTEIPDDQWQYLEGIDTLVLDALRWKEHPTHYSIEQALAIVARLQPQQTWFTHMSHDIGLHDEANRQILELLPQFGITGHVQLAYDTLVIDTEY